MPDDEIMYVSGNCDENDDSKELFVANEIVADNVIYKLIGIANTVDAHTTVSNANAPKSDPLECPNFSLILSRTFFHGSVKKVMPKFSKRVKKTIKADVPDIVLKPLYKEINALNKLESQRCVTLEKRLRKSIHKAVGKSVKKHVQNLVAPPANAATEGEKESQA
ncbi:hypothetical protein Tco_0327348 [Tanacetum coccineum]